MSLHEKEHERAAEQWLDEAIGHLRDAGPRAGLETRVLAGLRAHVEQGRQRWGLILAGSTAAVLLVALLMSWLRSKPANAPELVHHPRPPAPTDTISSPSVAVASRIPKASRPRTGHSELAATNSPRSNGMNAIEIKRDVFPSPAPLTEQGKMLQTYLRQTPPHELALVAARQPSLSSLESESLSIAPLQIADLTPKAEGTKDQDQK